MIEYDLRFLLAMCNWAETVRVKGVPLLERTPFKGFPVPSGANPRRPVATNEEFGRLTHAARFAREGCRAVPALAHETGHRCTAVGRLRWSDLDLEKGLITWRAELDKIGASTPSRCRKPR